MLPYLAAEGPSKDCPRQQLGTPTLESNKGKPTEARGHKLSLPPTMPSREEVSLKCPLVSKACPSQALSPMPFILDTQKVDRSQGPGQWGLQCEALFQKEASMIHLCWRKGEASALFF